MRERYCRDRGLDTDEAGFNSNFEKNSDATGFGAEEEEDGGEEVEDENEDEEEEREEPKFEFVKIPEPDIKKNEISWNISEKTKNVEMKSDKKDQPKNNLTETNDTSLMRGKSVIPPIVS